MYNLNWTSNDANVSQQMLFDLVTQRYDEIVSKFKIRFNHADETGRSSIEFSVEDNKNEAYFNVTEQRHRKFGKCYSVHPSKKYRLLGIYYIVFTL